jgi:formylglycine-generating enzyme required for sulfatase activity
MPDAVGRVTLSHVTDTPRTVRIFLSSPGDVAAERAQVRELLLGLARGPFVRGRVHIDVVSWDDPHGGATMDARLTPQQAVDRSLPTPAECDVTVVLLWGRMGTPLTETKADGTPYLSGTEWEIETALAADKPVLIYRRSEKVLLDTDDKDFDDKLAQKRRVDSFFAGFGGQGGPILRAHATYATPGDLLTRLRQDIERYLSEVLRDAAVGGEGDESADARPAARAKARVGRKGQRSSSPPDVPVAYREWVKKQHGGVDLLGLQLKKGRPPSLSAIYVPQTTTAAPSAEEPPRRPGRRPGIDVDMLGREREQHNLALGRLAAESLYVSGAPGTGKSTFCRWVAWLVAEGAMPSLDVLPPEGFAEALDDGLKGRLPLLLRLREFWEYLPPRAGATLTASDLEEAMGRWVDKKRPDGLDSGLLLAHLAHGSTLLVLDGMDEVPVGSTSSTGKWLPRQQLLSALADACPAWSKAGNRLLLTSRPYGLSADEAAGTSLGFAPLQPLPRQLQSLLAHRWFAVLSGEPEAGAETAADLFANIDSQPWLVELAANPLLLTAMCIVFDEGKRLPQDKHELYERVVATVLHSRYQDPADIDKAKRELGVIAYGMHTGAGLADGRTTPKAEATFHEVERWLQDYQDRKDYTERAEAGAFEAREALLSQSGLFLSTAGDRAGFTHLSFQEFFAAQRSFTVDEARIADVFLQRAATPEWRNTLSFLFGRLVGMFPEPKKAIDLLETRLDGAAASDTGLLMVLADAAQVLTGKGITLRPDRLQHVQRLLLEAMTGSAPVATRAEVGSALGRLGDPRFYADRWWLPDEVLLGFIEVDGGPFTMGSDPRSDRYARGEEQPQHPVELPDYYIARYPVTVAQFRAFVEDTRFEVGDPDCLRGVPNHPVAWVSFNEALAYCRWLTDKLRLQEWTPSALRERLTDGWVITLPSEAEWEKAARGRDGRIYPWGNEFDASRVNGRETGLGSASAVGLFPGGVSPCGALDMSGNVWEWTRSLWGKDFDKPSHKYPYRPDDARRENLEAEDDVLRVLRGGSFSVSENFLRAAFRSWNDPGNRFDFVGFRLVSSRLRS